MIEGFETFSPQERAYLDSKGEKPIDDAPAVEEEATDEVENEAETNEAAEVEASDEAETEDEAAEEDQKPKKDPRIPLRKLQESEKARKAVEADRDALKEQFARADERLRLLFNAQQQEQSKEPPPPDKNQDPLGYMEWQQEQIDRLAYEHRAQQEARQRQEQIDRIDSTYKQAWSAFASKTPEALPAYQHFVNVTAQFLELQGVPAEKINQLVENEERKIAVAAMQRGVSPAELIYEKAKAFGFKPKLTGKDPDNIAAKKAEDDIERRQKAQSASKSLSTAGGSRGGQSITAAELASMSDDEFEEVRSKLGERALRKLMGE